MWVHPCACKLLRQFLGNHHLRRRQLHLNFQVLRYCALYNMRGQNAIPHQRHEEILQFWTGHSRAKPLGPVTFNGSAIQKWFAGGPEVDQVSYSVSKPSITESGQLLTPRHGWQS